MSKLEIELNTKRLPTGYPKCNLCHKGILKTSDRHLFKNKVYHLKCLKAIAIVTNNEYKGDDKMPEICKSCPLNIHIITNANGLFECTSVNCPNAHDQIEDTRDGQTYGDF